MNIIDPSTFTPEKVAIPEDATQEQWASIHQTILICRKASRSWLKQSREWAESKWGADYVAEAETQMELALGLPQPDATLKPDLNPSDKSKAIVTIEGICQQFALWHRKMDSQIDSWDRPRIEKALALIEPIEREAKRLRGMLDA
jgi:hypothetical protein